ncbi:hypothetical protein AB1N83_008497 [Pleurotus pulmonarius]
MYSNHDEEWIWMKETDCEDVPAFRQPGCPKRLKFPRVVDSRVACMSVRFATSYPSALVNVHAPCAGVSINKIERLDCHPLDIEVGPQPKLERNCARERISYGLSSAIHKDSQPVVHRHPAIVTTYDIRRR